jgi:ribosomal protein S18 acetylase RimI-like enzyme
MPSSITFRDATSSDLPAIIDMLADDTLGRNREIVADPPAACYVEAFAAIDQDANNRLILALCDGEIAGCLQLTFIPGLSRQGLWRGQIESVRTARTFRGKGIGRALFEHAIAESRNRGCGLVQLTTDKTRADAHAFYEALGFSATHDGMKLSLES